MNLLTFQRDSTPVTGLPVSDTSKVNQFTMPSDSQENYPISMDHNRRLITGMVDNIFDEQKGTCEVSSSQCSSLKLQSSEYSYDRRLKYWKDVLKEREKVSEKIQQRTGKKFDEILYNNMTTVNERDKQTVKRLMDYAQRLNPVRLKTLKPLVLPEKCNTDNTGIPVAEIQETLPRAERNREYMVEISGLPKVTKMELLGKPEFKDCEKSSKWLKSKYLEKRIEEIREDIERVVEYYPDVENLQIIGESLKKTELQEHDTDIQILPSENISGISSDSADDLKNWVCKVEAAGNLGTESVEYGFKINDHVLGTRNKSCAKNVEIKYNFEGFPFQKEHKKVMTIHNIGRKVLTFEWSQRSYYETNCALHQPLDNEFVFDQYPFRLYGGETHDINVLYQPRKVGIVKSKWVLKVQPSFFPRKLDGIVLKLSGICAAPPEYERKLNEMQSEVIEKSNMKMMRKIIIELSVVVPALAPLEQICPYQRTLNEMELFEQFNNGFICERYHDLELLKNLYKRLKKPREKPWNLKIESLKCAIFGLANAEQRALYFNELCGILDGMKGKPLELEKRIFENPEREHTRLLYVGGMICATIDEWEDKTISLEEVFLKTSLQVVKPSEGNGLKDENSLNILENKTESRLNLLENYVRKLKSFRDSLYMQTYNLMCDFVENIVSVIEATDVV